MGRRGPKPTPTSILRSRGSWLANHRPDKNGPESAVPDPPTWISEEGMAWWQDIAPMLAEYGVLTNWDQDALALLIDAKAEYLALRHSLQIFERSIRHSSGALDLSEPDDLRQWKTMRRELRASHDTLVKLLAQFGMTPSSRTGVRIIPPRDPNEKDRTRHFR